MPELTFTKMATMIFPADKTTDEYIQSLKTGQVIHGSFSRARNYQFLKKYFALLNFAFEHQELGDVLYNGELVEPNFDEFRNNVTILAGYYTPVYDINGQVHLRAKSISFAKMDADEFEKLYQKTIDVILRKVLTRYTEEELHNTVNELMSFT